MVDQRTRRLWILAGFAALLLLAAGAVTGFRSAGPDVPVPPAAAQAPDPVHAPEPAAPSVEFAPPPAVAPAVFPAARQVPVLMYHEIVVGPNSLYVAPHELAAHLEYLVREGYTPVTLAQIYANFTTGGPIPDKPVVLTFDDGYASFYTGARPLLRQHGATGTLFVITGFVGKPGYVTWDQVAEMAAEGIEIGAHTVTHPDLAVVSDDRLNREIRESRALLEERSGRPVRFFAFPAGRYDGRGPAVLREAGYLGAVVTQRGMATPCQDAMLWRRVRVNKGTSVPALAALLRMAESETPACNP